MTLTSSRFILAACCSAAALVSSTPAAFAFSSGIGSSFFGPGGCNDCHSGGQKPTVSLTGPTQLAPGAVGTYTLSWSSVGTQNKGGFNVKAGAGVLSVIAGDSSVRTEGSELTHSDMKPASAGKVTFQFKFTAPAAGSSVTLSAWGNAVNGIAAATGDQASSASLVVAVSSVCPDSDGDGATAKTCGGTDCDDTNSAVKPGATEACNGTDDDCDGQTDEGLTKPTFYRDQDQDGFGDPAVTVQACTAPFGYVSSNTDCNDGNAAVKPSATETCNNTDDDCDGQTDEGLAQSTFYRDQDQDGFGDPAVTVQACTAPFGYVSSNTDCNDGNAAVKPTAGESCNDVDDDCDGQADEGLTKPTFYRDQDQDGFGDPAVTIQACTAPFGYVSSNTDCNDGNAAVKPSATETCNSADDDCDGQTDEGLTKPTFYRDQDQDGFGDAAVSTQACTAPGGYVTSKTDCDDASAAVKPGATETCNTVDDDCDSQTDEGLQSTFYRDQDQDGFGIPSTTISACTAPLGYVSASNDCNDDDGTIRPGALEVCDAVDNDCDGQVDEGLVKTFFRDQDGDGVGTAVSSVVACVAPPGYVSSNLDCNDADVAIKPGAVELCNGLDDDCDVVVDEGLVRPTFYRDEDQDGVGTSSDSKTACEAPPGYVVQSGDCSDTNPLVKPGAAEACNGGDDDCDGQIDEGLVKPTFYQDDDGDGYGAAAILTTACTAPPGFVADASDCDDAAGSVHPNASEICNLADDDCDGLVDDGLPTATYFRDGDGDGVGDDLDSIVACEQPVGYVSVSGDCDDDESLVSPSATERCNDRDDDCDDEVDEGLAMSTYFADVDLDGHGDADSTVVACAEPFAYVSVAGDCDDTRATIHPGAQEQCNEEDDDCDGAVDESVVSQTFYRDADADTWGRFDIALTDCRQPVGYVTRAGDCDDADADKNPTEPELCNDIDDDCDGITDEDLTLPVFYVDLDQDGYGDPASAVTACAAPMGTVSSGNDCDDGDAAIKPGAAELCNATDDDCDGGTDEGLAKFPFFRDADADGQGDIAQSISSCAVPDGYVSVLGDCDDQDPNVHGAAVEVCDGVDQDCDGAPDDGLTTSEWHPDVDLDGYGTGAVTVVSCAAPFGHVADAGDCDDGANGVNPAATETCNDVDDDCNGTADDGVEKPTWYADDDQDGYGAAASFVVACVVPPGFTASAGDCDDLETGVNPAAAETCNEVDDDCDGAIDQGLPTLVYYRDDDDDSWGRSDQTSTSCRAPAGFVVRGLDCDDQRDTVHPEAMETCNGRDDDCDEVTDDGVTVLLYTDADGDGYGDASSPVQVCAAGTGLASVAGDCNDAVDTIHPDATEAPNGIDDDCDGIADDGTELGDDDGDGYSEVENDCDDGDELVFPGQTELENGVDDDCDTVVDDGTPAYDDDGDGFSEKAGDCDDDNTSVFEGAVELEDELDNDCDGEVDEDLAAVDADEDGYDATVDCDDESEFISPAAIEVENALDDDCDGEVDEGTPAGDDDDDGVSENDGDCDDSDAAIVPGAAELANGIDDDCDGTIDDNTDVYDDDGDGYSEVEGDCNDASIGQGPDAEELQNGIDDDCDSETDEGSADGVDGTDTTDSTDAGDATDGLDGTDTTDASDGADATDAEDGADATDGADSVDGDAGDDATGADDGTDSADDVGAADAVDSSDGVDDAAAAGVEAESSSGCALGEGRRSTGVGFTLLLLVAALGWAVRRRA